MPGWRITLPAAVALALIVCSPVGAQQAETVMTPLSFHGESGKIPIGACLQLKVRTYPETPWWLSTAKAGAAEKAMGTVLTALKTKNRKALLDVAEPPSPKTAKEFDTQVDALMQQLAALNVTSIRRAYEFDGLLVFDVKVQAAAGGSSIAAPFSFVLASDGTAKYLPVRPEGVTFTLVQDLLGRDPAADASVCNELKGRFTHRATLASPRPGASTASPSALYLVGSPIPGASGPAKELAQTAQTAFMELGKVASRSADALAARMTPEGAARLKKWWTTSSEEERAKYVATLTDGTPFFLFDAAPIVVVYSKSSAGNVDVVYFLRQGGGLVWTNAYRITVSDRVFKAGPLFEAAKQPSPFSTFLLK